MSIEAPFTTTLERVGISRWINQSGRYISQLVRNKMAHTDGRKYSSECGSTKTSKLSCGTCYKGRGCCYGLCTVAFFFNGVYEPISMDFDFDIGNDNEIFSSY